MPEVNNPNLLMIEMAAEKLGLLVDVVVFLGGCATGLLITDPATPPMRVTWDVDVIVEVASLSAYHRFSKMLLSLVYYPPYHSKHNPIERVWGVLENHWRGQILDSFEKTLGLARSMTYNGNHPVVKLVNRTYEKGVKLTEKAMQKIENMIERLPGIEKWAVEIPCY